MKNWYQHNLHVFVPEVKKMHIHLRKREKKLQLWLKGWKWLPHLRQLSTGQHYHHPCLFLPLLLLLISHKVTTYLSWYSHRYFNKKFLHWHYSILYWYMGQVTRLFEVQLSEKAYRCINEESHFGVKGWVSSSTVVVEIVKLISLLQGYVGFLGWTSQTMAVQDHNRSIDVEGKVPVMWNCCPIGHLCTSWWQSAAWKQGRFF